MTQNLPPSLPLRFFRWFCHRGLRDAIEGDLVELYRERLKKSGKRKADWHFAWDVLLLFRPGIIRNMEVDQPKPNYGMLKNYFKISFRHLAKNKTFAAINIGVLTLGFSCFLILSLYLYDELSFDGFHRDAGRIYRIVQHETQDNGTERSLASVAPAIGAEAKEQFPEVEDMCRLTALGRVTLGNDPMTRSHEPSLSADPNFFTFFDFPLVEGDPETALLEPDRIVISESIREKYFGKDPALGKQIWSGLSRQGQPVYLTVSGVMKDFPKNSHLDISILFSDATWHSIFKDYAQYVRTEWAEADYTTYLKVNPQSNIPDLIASIDKMVKANYPVEKEFRSKFDLQPLPEIHTQSSHFLSAANEFNARSIKPFYLYMFAALALILLATACLNYMNLSTAVAIKRTREIGTRKTLGAPHFHMVGQFLTDSVVMTTFSLLLAAGIVQTALPYVNRFTDKDISLLGLPAAWLAAAVALVFFMGILSAAYPSYIAMQVSVVDAMKRKIKVGSGSLSVRKTLLIVQFAISIMMIASTLVIHRQLEHMREKDLGFRYDNLLVVDINSRALRNNFETVKNEFANPSEVISVTTSTRVPGEWKSFPVASAKTNHNTNGSDMIFVGIDKDFLDTYQIKLLEGRSIIDPVADSTKIVVTQLALEQLGITDPIGQIIEIPRVRYGETSVDFDRSFRAEIIGVVEDFHFESLRSQLMPVIFGAPNTVIQQIDYYTLKINTNDWAKTLETLKEINHQLDPDNPLEYTFLDSRFAEMYKADTKRSRIFLTLSIVVVLIACLGLFALVSYAVENRIKEIGVRKVLGASVGSIIGLISREFLLLVLIAGGIGLPAAWFFMHSWLEEFAYRVPFGIWIFGQAIVVTMIIAFTTIGLRTLGAATMNPVKSLKSE